MYDISEDTENILLILKKFRKISPSHLRFLCGQDSFNDLYMKVYIFLCI